MTEVEKPIAADGSQSAKKKGGSGGGSGSADTRGSAVKAPDRKLWNAKIEEESKACEQLRLQIAEVQRKLSQNSEGRDEFNRKKAELRGRLDTLQVRIDSLEEDRSKLIVLVDEKQKQRNEMRSNVLNLKKTIGFSSEDDIDKKISEITKHMQTSTMSLKDEKKLMLQISQLKSSKPLVGKYASLESNANSFEDNSIVPIRSRVDSIRTELTQLRESKKEEQEKYKRLMEERSKATGPIKELIDERDELNGRLQEHIGKRKEHQDEFNKEHRKYLAYQSEIKQQKDEKNREERKKRQAQQERQNIERLLEREEEAPLQTEVQLVLQAMSYMRKIVNQKGDEDAVNGEDEKKLLSEIAEKKEEGEEMLLPKNKRDEEYFFAPKKKSGASKKGGAAKRSRTLKLDIGTLQYFQKCGVAAPVSFDNIPHCLEKLQTKLDTYREQQRLRTEESSQRRLQLLAQLDVLDGKPPRVPITATNKGGGNRREAAAESEDNELGEEEELEDREEQQQEDEEQVQERQEEEEEEEEKETTANADASA